MAKQFCPEFVEAVVYNEAVTAPHNQDIIEIKVTQHSEDIYMLKLYHLTSDGELEKVIIRRLFYLPYKKEKIIRLAIEVIDDYCTSYVNNGLKHAVEKTLRRLDIFSEIYERNIYVDYECEQT